MGLQQLPAGSQQARLLTARAVFTVQQSLAIRDWLPWLLPGRLVTHDQTRVRDMSASDGPHIEDSCTQAARLA